MSTVHGRSGRPRLAITLRLELRQSKAFVYNTSAAQYEKSSSDTPTEPLYEEQYNATILLVDVGDVEVSLNRMIIQLM